MVRWKKYFPMDLFFGEVIAHTIFYLFGLVVLPRRQDKPLCSPFFVILSPCSSLGHERPYACVDFQRSGSKELVNIGESESTSESTEKQLPTRKPTEESTQISRPTIISTPTIISKPTIISTLTKERVQYAVFCSLAHQPCPQGNDFALEYFDIEDASSFSC